MPNHQASEQMLGYLYQVRYALALLLENDNSDCQISIEKFDDVAFSKDDIPIQLRFLYKGIIINQNKKLSQPTLKRRFFKKKAAFFSWPGLGKEWC